MFERDTNVEVKDVPTLVPIMTGIPSLRDITPEAANATTSEVVADDEWMMEVARTPIIKPKIGFCRFALVRMLPDTLEHRSLKEMVRMDFLILRVMVSAPESQCTDLSLRPYFWRPSWMQSPDLPTLLTLMSPFDDKV